jgi:NADH-quinone oxidoreductase subunit D
MWGMRDRDMVIKLLEDVAGSRMFYVNMRMGGLNKQLPPDFKERAYKLTGYLEESVPKYKEFMEGNSIFMERTKGIGILSKKEAINYGVSGPVLRGSGVEYDVRKADPHYIYDKMKFRIPVKSEGDVFARYRVRYEEILESIRIIRQALDAMPENGDVTGMPIKLITTPAKPDTVIISRELPRGEGLIYMIPDKQRPYRISLRSPAFTNVSVLPHLAKNAKLADLFSIIGSLDIVLAEIDR